MGVVFRVGVDGNMALVQVHGGACRKRAGRFVEVFSGDFNDRTFRYQDGDTCSLGDIILLGHIQHMSPDDVRHMCQYARQTFRIVLFINIFDVRLPLFSRFRIAYIVHIEA